LWKLDGIPACAIAVKAEFTTEMSETDLASFGSLTQFSGTVAAIFGER